MRAKVQAGAHPWIDSWNILIANSHSSSNYVANPVGTLVRGTGNVFRDFGRPNSDADQLKAILAAEIIKILNRQKLTVRAAHAREPRQRRHRARGGDLGGERHGEAHAARVREHGEGPSTAAHPSKWRSFHSNE